ncbi:MAG: hypothetical protein QOJ64_901 [Acidobacteriota bacterium]|jgi:hypothetical protein|nr:hypothetical protein [Acidobacteriota bacterium]
MTKLAPPGCGLSSLYSSFSCDLCVLCAKKHCSFPSELRWNRKQSNIALSLTYSPLY